MKKPVQPQTSKSEKERVTVELDSMDGVISRLEDNSKRIQQFELWYCIVSLLAVFASLNNFELSEARNMRIILYSLMSIALEFFRKMMKMQANIDPLFLHTRTHLLRVGQQLLYIDMCYLLIRIVHHVHITEATFVILHYIYAIYDSKLINKDARGASILNPRSLSYRRLQPALLFVLCKIIPSEFSEVSLLFLCLTTLNLIVMAQVGKIVLFSGDFVLNIWYEKLFQMEEVKGKKPNNRTRRFLLKNMLVLLSFFIVLQNGLLIVEVLRFEVAIGLIQTLIVGGYTYYGLKFISDDHNR